MRPARSGRIASLLAATALSLLVPAWAAAAGPPEAADPAAKKPLKFMGVFQALFISQPEANDSFTLRRARFILSGELVKGVSFKLSAEGVKSPFLVDAQVDVAIHKALGLRFGQFKVPFSLESTTSAFDLDSINRSQAILKLSPGQDIGSGGRDVGLTLTGSASILDYEAGIFNGSGINKLDPDEHKDFAGRLVVRPAGFLALGASIYDGSNRPADGSALVRRDRTGFDVSAAAGPFTLRGDFIAARDGDVKRVGWYLQGGAFVLPAKLQGIVKLDAYDQDRSAPGDRSTVTTLGANWYLRGRTKLQVNVDLTKREGSAAKASLLVHFQAAF